MNWTKEQEFQRINKLQEKYVNELIEILSNPDFACFKEINFTSPTGTGKTNMMAKLICSEYGRQRFFVITSLSKGRLNTQIQNRLEELCIGQSNFVVHGLSDYTQNTRKQSDDFLFELPQDKEIIWLRDEGHINTNRWAELYEDKVHHIVNFSATPKIDFGVNCSFADTYMLRAVNQQQGTPLDAIKKLIEVKKQHVHISNYNPCLVARCLDEDIYQKFVSCCQEFGLKYINLSCEDSSVIEELCKDDNEYDVIINKFKITEGIDIRRAHVIYMSNQPGNPATTIQVIGRARRNALLYRNDIDIFSENNLALLKATTQCYVFFNADMKIDSDSNGDLCYALCNRVSVEQLHAGAALEVENGQMLNGLFVIELEGCSGIYHIIKDIETGFNVIKENVPFYNEQERSNGVKVCGKILSRRFVAANWEKKERYQWGGVSDVYVDTRNTLNITPNSLKVLVTKIKTNAATKQEQQQLEHICQQFEIDFDSLMTFSISKILLTLIKNLKPIEINASRIDDYPYEEYTQIFNDRESAIIGTDLMKFVDNKEKGGVWLEDSSVTSKVGKWCKLNQFISNKYRDVIEQHQIELFHGKNQFNFDSRCNSCFGYCVEYYIKYLLWGEDFLQAEILQAKSEALEQKIRAKQEFLVVRACILKYKEDMKKAFGQGVGKVIQTISVEKLISKNYLEFVNTVITVATRAARRIHNTFPSLKNNHSPILSIQHIKGLADFISEDTILDIKATSEININHLKQVLAYHYLSTKRSDLKIKQVAIYEVITDKLLIVKL